VPKRIPRKGITIVKENNENRIESILEKTLNITYVVYGLIYLRILSILLIRQI
tara:strand:- start:481 stop:639 length:159 start_codon:yes stop_codon:yes gene_type:complete